MGRLSFSNQFSFLAHKKSTYSISSNNLIKIQMYRTFTDGHLVKIYSEIGHNRSFSVKTGHLESNFGQHYCENWRQPALVDHFQSIFDHHYSENWPYRSFFGQNGSFLGRNYKKYLSISWKLLNLFFLLNSRFSSQLNSTDSSIIFFSKMFSFFVEF